MGRTRERIVEALAAQPAAVSVEQLAGLTRLHPSTLRAHLPAMVRSGLVRKEARPLGGVGRPRVHYGAGQPAGQPGGRDVEGGQPGDDGERVEDYRMLAQALADAMTTAPHAGAVAYRAGRRWAEGNSGGSAGPDTGSDTGSDAGAGAGSDTGAAPVGVADLHAGVGEVVRLLAEQGLAPRLAANGRDITIRRCPFEALARSYRDIVCQAHVGMVSGAIEALETPVCVLSFQPWRTEDPLTCRVRVGPAGPR